MMDGEARTPPPDPPSQVRFVVQYSGGVGSYEAARRLVDREGREGVVLLFADTLIEDPDLYRFLDQSSALLGVPVTRVADGRTPWQVFRDERFIGNARRDPCSKILKRQLCDRWVRENAPDAVRVFGLDWSEGHRIKAVRERMAEAGWMTEFPLDEPPLFHKPSSIRRMEKDGLDVPRLYRLGFAHNNCGGFCIKAGHGHYAMLLEKLPEVYAHHEAEEQSVVAMLARDDVGVMTDRRGGQRRAMTMRQFRERVQRGDLRPDMDDVGGCGCFVVPDDAIESEHAASAPPADMIDA